MELSLAIGGMVIVMSIPLSILIYFLSKPEKFERWVAIMYGLATKMASTCKYFRTSIDRRAVACSIQADINGACARLYACEDIFPHPVRVEWVGQEGAEPFIARGQVVVRLRRSVNHERNVVSSVLLYVKAGLMPRARHYLDERLRAACEARLVANMLAASKNEGALSYFLGNELEDLVAQFPDLRQDIQMLEDVDSVGIFTRVFLVEVKNSGDKLLGAIPTPAIQDEIRKFAEFLRTIATKDHDDVAPLAFNGSRIRVAIVLVGRRDCIDAYGVRPYVDRVHRCLREGYESAYVIAWGDYFVKRVAEIL